MLFGGYVQVLNLSTLDYIFGGRMASLNFRFGFVKMKFL